MAALDIYWNEARSLGRKEIASYTERWNINQQNLDKVSEHFNDKGKPGKAIMEIPILYMSWPQFVLGARKEFGGEFLKDRLYALRKAHDMFRTQGSLCKMEYKNRRRIAGVYLKHSRFQWFGSMVGAGHFKHAIKNNDIHVSKALDKISLKGEVTKEAYGEYLAELRHAFPRGGLNVGVASRLLAIKRPDLFVCLNNKNRRKLALAFALPQEIDFEAYWNSIVKRIQAATWWQAPCPKNETNTEIWRGRAAMLDAIFYERHPPAPKHARQ